METQNIIVENKWISIKTDLPVTCGMYLVFVQFKNNDLYYTTTAWYETGFAGNKIGWHYKKQDKHEYISHWMTLPNPPGVF
jgi:hypothetical protein